MVASGWKATPPTLSLCPFNVNTLSQLGTVHTLQSPDHEPVTNSLESGLKAHWAIGRSSAICEDQFEYALSLLCSSFLLAFNKANGMLDSSFCRSFLCLALFVILSIKPNLTLIFTNLGSEYFVIHFLASNNSTDPGVKNSSSYKNM